MHRQGYGEVIDLTGSNWIHDPVEPHIEEDWRLNSQDTSLYADTGSYEYKYAGISAMTPGIPIVQSKSQLSVLCYKILSLGVKPYIMFGLCHMIEGLKLPRANMEDMELTVDGGKRYLKDRFLINETKYQGYLQQGSETILCIEDTAPNMELFGNQDIQWVLSTEIINHAKLLENNIDSCVVKLFEAYPSLLFLYDEVGNLHESPDVGFYKTYNERAAALAVLGAPRDEPLCDTGPYYRFFEYDNVVCQSDKNDSSVVLTRFALFLGRTTMSSLGDWSEYDSLRKPDGTICVREYNQQIPLSCHRLS